MFIDFTERGRGKERGSRGERDVSEKNINWYMGQHSNQLSHTSQGSTKDMDYM